MKKKQHKYIEFNKPVHLYLDDLLEIENILKEKLKVKTFKISFDDYEADGFKEILEGTENVGGYLKIETSEPYITITIYKFKIAIWILTSTLEIEGATAEINDLLKHRIRMLSYYSRKIINLGGYLIIVLASISSFFWLDQISKNNRIIFLVILLLAFILWIFTTLKPINSIIDFQKKKNAPNFFQRNKDRVLVGLIVGIPVAILSFLLGFIFRK